MVVRTATKAMIALYPYPWIFNQSHRNLEINYYRFFSFKNAGKKVPVMYENFGENCSLAEFVPVHGLKLLSETFDRNYNLANQRTSSYYTAYYNIFFGCCKYY